MTFGDKVMIVARLAWGFARTLWSTLLIMALSVLFTLGTIQVCFWMAERHVPLWAFIVGGSVLLCVVTTTSFVAYTLWKYGWEHFAGDSPPKPDDQTPSP
jgi:membrane protein YdbS with pleckstrin-like domain